MGKFYLFSHGAYLLITKLHLLQRMADSGGILPDYQLQ